MMTTGAATTFFPPSKMQARRNYDGPACTHPVLESPAQETKTPIVRTFVLFPMQHSTSTTSRSLTMIHNRLIYYVCSKVDKLSGLILQQQPRNVQHAK